MVISSIFNTDLDYLERMRWLEMKHLQQTTLYIDNFTEHLFYEIFVIIVLSALVDTFQRQLAIGIGDIGST